MPSLVSILVLSGRPEKLQSAASALARDNRVTVRPFEEKDITAPAKVRSAVREGTPQAIAFGCKDLDLQRFQVALKFYLLVYGHGHRFLIDESGRIIPATWGRFLFVDVPKFIVEIVASAAVLLHAAVRLSGLKSYAEGRR